MRIKKKKLILVDCSLPFGAIELYKEFFEFKKVVNLPLIDIIISRNTFYFFDIEAKAKHRLQYKLVRLMRKKFKPEKLIDFYDLFFKRNTTKKTIIISHQVVFAYMLLNYLPQDYRQRIDLINFECFDLYTRRESIFNSIENKFSKYIYIADITFKGKIIIINHKDSELIQYIKRKYPNASIYIKFIDIITPKLEKFSSVQQILDNTPTTKEVLNLHEELCHLKKQGIFLYTYSEIEAKFYGMNYEPNVLSLKSYFFNNAQFCNNVLFAAFNLSKDRFYIIINLIKSLERAKLKSLICLGMENPEQRKTIEELYNACKYVSFTPSGIDHSEYLKLQKSSPVIFDIYRIYPDEGFSYRISEALSWNKKIITNRTLIKYEAFYNSDMILISETMNFAPDELIKFILTKPAEYTNIDDFDIKSSIFS